MTTDFMAEVARLEEIRSKHLKERRAKDAVGAAHAPAGDGMPIEQYLRTRNLSPKPTDRAGEPVELHDIGALMREWEKDGRSQ